MVTYLSAGNKIPQRMLLSARTTPLPTRMNPCLRVGKYLVL